MTDFSLVPVDHQADFSDVSLVPVDHVPFGADDTIQQAQTHQKSPPQQPAMGADQPNIGVPAIGAGQSLLHQTVA